MLKHFFTTLLCAGVTYGFSQSHLIKGYLAYGHQNNPGYFYSDQSKDIQTNDDPTDPDGYYQIGYAHEKANNNIHEFLLGGNAGTWQDFRKGGPDFERIGRVRYGSIHFQQEFKRKKCYDEKRKATVYGGVFYNLSLNYADFESSSADVFSVSANKAEVRFGLVPGTQINMGKRWVMDLNMAVSICSFGLETRKKLDPALTASQQKSTVFNTDFPIKTMLRVGIGYRLGKV